MESYRILSHKPTRSAQNVQTEWRIRDQIRWKEQIETAVITRKTTRKWFGQKFHVKSWFWKCLILYPQSVWEEKSKEVNQLNPYNIKNREFARFFFRGATQVDPDSSSRIVIPKSLLEHAGISQDIILLAYHNQVEIWSKDAYLKMIQEEPADFAKLAEEVFRHKDVWNRI